MKRTILAVGIILAVTAAAIAHGNEKHVMGTVSKVASDSITVTTISGEQTVNIVPATMFSNQGNKAALADVKVGDRVVIHAKQNGSSLVADEVKIGAPSQDHTGH